ncbi:MAG TPA: NAD-dependent epimerase/dehydratase family protein [Steroidobacteraceae bacterium]|nr:NAD-dependent epimerase/dehydratase family protein [Steroidobacteraceae bacterium]
MNARCVFVTGGTGYMGRALIPALLARGYRVRALARAGSTARVPPGAERGAARTGDAGLRRGAPGR